MSPSHQLFKDQILRIPSKPKYKHKHIHYPNPYWITICISPTEQKEEREKLDQHNQEVPTTGTLLRSPRPTRISNPHSIFKQTNKQTIVLPPMQFTLSHPCHVYRRP
ncbi:hypothetical protein OCU04_012337 [Sclerotinia nivalis]|uniref:Uncharacterized protein n=1 Tax=Sclerotinia nivalis TaxID=352851 RepID=A0A9X0DDE6_9HELO|nr:hypothetical protein OCU04_012337 [Sclerotinia nivalis]